MRRRAKRIRVGEGQVFAVPLDMEPVTFARCVVARRHNDVALFGYFFGPAQVDATQLGDLASLHPATAQEAASGWSDAAMGAGSAALQVKLKLFGPPSD